MPIWQPRENRRAAANLVRFARSAERRAGRDFSSYAELHHWSITHLEEFWDEVWRFCGVIGERGDQVLADSHLMPGAKWFPGASLNYAENVLRRRDGSVAIVFWDETKVSQRLTWRELYAQVARASDALRALGVGRGDRVAG